MKIAVLEGYAVNPGDLNWDWLKAFGSFTVYPHLVSPEETIARIGDADVILINKTPITSEILVACPDFCFWDTPQMESAGKTLGICGQYLSRRCYYGKGSGRRACQYRELRKPCCAGSTVSLWK